MTQIQTFKQYDFLSKEYAALFERTDASGFQSPIWLDQFYRHLPQTRNADPFILTVHEEGRLVAVLPMIKRRSKGFLLIESADLGVGDYSAPVVDTSFSVDQNLSSQINGTFGSYDLLRVRPVRSEHVGLWEKILGVEPLTLDFSAHAVELEPPFEQWRAEHLDKKIGGMIARKGRRWRKQHRVEMELMSNPKAIDLAIRNLAKLRFGRFEGDPIQRECVQDFYCAVAAQGPQSGANETWLATSDGQVAAIVFGLTHKGQFLYLLIGADYENHGRHSPGLQMYDWIIENWMDRGGTCFDFTIGDEPFKAQFGAEPTAMSAFLKGNSLRGKAAALVLKQSIVRARRSNSGGQ